MYPPQRESAALLTAHVLILTVVFVLILVLVLVLVFVLVLVLILIVLVVVLVVVLIVVLIVLHNAVLLFVNWDYTASMRHPRAFYADHT